MQIAPMVAASGIDLMALLPFLQVESTHAAEIAGLDDYSVQSLVMRAGPVVKAVMLLLALMSVWSWTIAIDKFLGMMSARSKAKKFEQAFWSGQPMDEIDDRVSSKPSEAMARVFTAGSREWRDARHVRDLSVSEADSLLERARTQMGVAVTRETSRMETGLPTLAIIGTSAPFIGLFGTVWGVMNSFRSIAAAQESNLAVVAPGIAEALFATALGLFAAIPATIFYNKFSAEINSFADHMDTFADEFAVRLSRRINDQLDS